MVPIGGWKTKAGAILVGLGTTLKLLGDVEFGEALELVGTILLGPGVTLLGLGIGHKIAKGGVK